MPLRTVLEIRVRVTTLMIEAISRPLGTKRNRVYLTYFSIFQMEPGPFDVVYERVSWMLISLAIYGVVSWKLHHANSMRKANERNQFQSN